VTAAVITVPVMSDLTEEPTEHYFVNLTGATNARIDDAQGRGTIRDDDGPPVVDVVWTNVSGAIPSGNTLTKSSATGWGNAGGISAQSIGAGNGFMEFTAVETNTRRMAGLGIGDSSQSHVDLEFGLLLVENGPVWVYESGISRGQLTTYTSGDTFRVGVESGAVKYWKNGLVFYTSAVAPIYPLLVDTALYTNGAAVSDVVVHIP
jgi:hypothetical protein